jgi:hypothetical protein
MKILLGRDLSKLELKNRKHLTTATKRAKVSASDRATMKLNLNNIATSLELLKANNIGTMPHGAIVQVVKEKKTMLPWLTTERVNNHLKALNKKRKTSLLDVTNTIGAPAQNDVLFVSTLTPDNAFICDDDARRRQEGK